MLFQMNLILSQKILILKPNKNIKKFKKLNLMMISILIHKKLLLTTKIILLIIKNIKNVWICPHTIRDKPIKS